MTLELFSTSVPAGLEPGRSGFCTVAMTRSLSRPLVEALESLSAYRPVFLPTDPRADDNPVTVSYLRVPVAGRNYHVVSRIGFAGLDYTSRSNRFAHHVVLDASDPRPPGGPAWLASRPGFLEAAFDGEVRYLARGPGRPRRRAGLRRVPDVAEADRRRGLGRRRRRGAGEPRGAVVLPGLRPGGRCPAAASSEAVGLLPPERRWEATFTTYFTGLPAGVGCTVRGVLRGSAEAAAVAGVVARPRQAGGQDAAGQRVDRRRAGRQGRRLAAGRRQRAGARRGLAALAGAARDRWHRCRSPTSTSRTPSASTTAPRWSASRSRPASASGSC